LQEYLNYKNIQVAGISNLVIVQIPDAQIPDV